jgi:hypothetical protein
MNTDSTVSRQWATRPDDQRFLSLDDLHASVKGRAERTKTFNMKNKFLKTYGTDPSSDKDLGELVIVTEDGVKSFTNWSFGQLAGVAGAPAGYLRKLTSPLAAACLNEGLSKSQREESMLQTNGNDTLRCATSTTYGRIWDYDVVEKIQEVTVGTNWKVPSASYSVDNPKRATTLYASDRDVFVFLVDEDHPIQLPGQTKPSYRGFYAWNSEVGAQTFGLAAFLYETVCDNRIIWGISNKHELRIKHSSGAPERFLQEGRKTLIEYANESVQPMVQRVQRAMNIKLGNTEDEVKEFLKKRGLNLSVATSAINAAKMEEGDFTSAWDIAQGITAHARTIAHTDSRILVEREAGKILEMVTQ